MKHLLGPFALVYIVILWLIPSMTMLYGGSENWLLFLIVPIVYSVLWLLQDDWYKPKN